MEKQYMDSIYLTDLKVETTIGIWDWERKIKQTVVIDLEMGTDIRSAVESDSIEDTLNYKQVAKRVQQFVADSSFMLVEALAGKIAEIILNEFDVQWVKLKVSKPGAIRGSRNVGVSIHRCRDE
jgi:dihydroneopterin aldolase